MFRRKGFRSRRIEIGPAPHPLLQRANELMAIQDFSGAAQAFEELAQRTLVHEGPAAPYLYTQAGLARIQAGQVTLGMEYIQKALTIFAERGEWLRFHRNRRRISGELYRLRLEREGNFIASYQSGDISSDIDGSFEESKPARSPIMRLPTKCMSCGASLRSDEVDWIDDTSAECPYCGSLVRSQR